MRKVRLDDIREAVEPDEGPSMVSLLENEFVELIELIYKSGWEEGKGSAFGANRAWLKSETRATLIEKGYTL